MLQQQEWSHAISERRATDETQQKTKSNRLPRLAKLPRVLKAAMMYVPRPVGGTGKVRPPGGDTSPTHRGRRLRALLSPISKAAATELIPGRKSNDPAGDYCHPRHSASSPLSLLAFLCRGSFAPVRSPRRSDRQPPSRPFIQERSGWTLSPSLCMFVFFVVDSRGCPLSSLRHRLPAVNHDAARVFRVCRFRHWSFPPPPNPFPLLTDISTSKVTRRVETKEGRPASLPSALGFVQV
ncbi:hypothetical protein MRX96_054471 [Rhipicephalus microplus]